MDLLYQLISLMEQILFVGSRVGIFLRDALAFEIVHLDNDASKYHSFSARFKRPKLSIATIKQSNSYRNTS